MKWRKVQTVLWNSRGQHEYLVIYQLELKTAFDTGQLEPLLLNDTSHNETVSSQVKLPLIKTSDNRTSSTSTMNETIIWRSEQEVLF